MYIIVRYIQTQNKSTHYGIPAAGNRVGLN